MNFKLTFSAVVFGLVAVTGCAVDGSEGGTSTDSDLVAPAPVDVKGAWRTKPGTATSPFWFDGVVFKADGTFFAGVNTGIVCDSAPCPSRIHLSGTYNAVGASLVLDATPGEADSGMGFYGRFTIARQGGTLKIARDGNSGELTLETSYCSLPSDCEGQGIIVPACVGGWTCSAQNSCAYACGVAPVTSDVWPEDRAQLVAETLGGGFTPPAPAGSTCTIGAAKYTLDLASRKLAWEVCSFTDWSTPLSPVRGERTIAPSELADVDAAMRAVKVTTSDICGADKPVYNIRVTSAAKGTVEYTDSFYACLGGDRTYVDNIGGVFGAFRDLAGK